MTNNSKIHWSDALNSLVEVATRTTLKPFTQPATLVDVDYIPKDILSKCWEGNLEGLQILDMNFKNELTVFLENVGVSKRAPVILNFR